MNNKQRSELFKVIQNLISEYESNLEKKHVFKPLSYTLYKMWREVDRKERRKENK